MNSYPIGVVVCRIVAIWSIFSALGGVGLVVQELLTGPDNLVNTIALPVLMVLLPLVAAFVFWHYAESISSTKYGAPYLVDGSIGTKDILMIGMHLLGIYLLVMGLAKGAYTEINAWMTYSFYVENDLSVDRLSASKVGGRVSNFIQVLAGLALLIRGKNGLR